MRVFRRKKGLRAAAGGGGRWKGKTMRGIWSFSACIYRYVVCLGYVCAVCVRGPLKGTVNASPLLGEQREELS